MKGTLCRCVCGWYVHAHTPVRLSVCLPAFSRPLVRTRYCGDSLSNRDGNSVQSCVCIVLGVCPRKPFCLPVGRSRRLSLSCSLFLLACSLMGTLASLHTPHFLSPALSLAPQPLGAACNPSLEGDEQLAPAVGASAWPYWTVTKADYVHWPPNMLVKKPGNTAEPARAGEDT